MWQRREIKGHALWQVVAWQDLAWLVHGVTTRGSGNLALHIGDNPKAVIDHRLDLSQSLGVTLDDWVTGNQVHQAEIANVTQELRGMGSHQAQTALAATDGLLTNQSDLLLASFYADCVPLLFIERSSQAIALAHAGWRGTVLNIAAKMVKKMQQQYNVRAQDIEVGIGPAIGPCCYEVGSEVASQFDPKVVQVNHQNSTLNLKEANYLKLVEAGVVRENIHCSLLCTSCESEFFSYRREGLTSGRIAAIILQRDV